MKLEISGYGYEKLLNDMNENSISCFNVKSEKENLYLEIYKKLLTDDGAIFFETDNRILFDYSLETFEAAGFRLEKLTFDLHNSEWEKDNLHTEYEDNFSAKGFTINRVEAYKN